MPCSKTGKGRWTSFAHTAVWSEDRSATGCAGELAQVRHNNHNLIKLRSCVGNQRSACIAISHDFLKIFLFALIIRFLDKRIH